MSATTTPRPTDDAPARPDGAATGRNRRAKHRALDGWIIAYAGLLTLLGVLLLLQMATAGTFIAPAVAALLITAIVSLASPRHGLYVITFLALVGDGVLVPWFPFVRNFSQRQSALFLHDALAVSPLELSLVGLLGAVVLRRLLGQEVEFRAGTLLKPLVVFVGLAGIALGYGIARGGDTNIALWEVRPISYLLLLYVAASVLLTHRDHYQSLLLVASAALSLEGLHAAILLTTTTNPDILALEGAGYLEHSASLHFNLVFLWLVAMRVFGERRAAGKRWLLWLSVPAMLTTYLLAERRSAMVALAVGIIMLGFVLHQRRPGIFWVVAPIVTVLGLGFIGATWNASGPISLPATAVKSVVAPEQLSLADARSNLYRLVETYNLVFTIRERPLLGSGFGHPFIQFIPLPELPFAWADYFPHNSVLWIWINMGLAGMLSLFALLGLSIRQGASIIRELPPRDGAMAFVATAFVVMYAVYAYVDIAWDIQSMVLLGLSIALIGNLRDLPGSERP